MIRAAAAQFGNLLELVGEGLHGSGGRVEQLADGGVARRVGPWRAALLHLAQPVVQGLDQQAPALRVVEQVVLQVGVALHHPDVAEHLVQHPGGAARLALLAEPVQQFPGTRPEDADDDLAVGEGGVVVRNLAQPGRVVRGVRRGGDVIERDRCVHDCQAATAPVLHLDTNGTAAGGRLRLSPGARTGTAPRRGGG